MTDFASRLRAEFLGNRTKHLPHYFLWPTFVAVLAITLFAYGNVGLRDENVELRAERDEARAEVERLKSLPPQRVCRTTNRGIEYCVTVQQGM